ncbi:ABC transporter substrate-binding protein [Clostridium sp.]|uniref:ABC transporter substrate-binding protein n=1 Tax=Clostridium sp. TaxID=1506 RepID=UPI001A3FFC78|nr:ABC transporter substrate-binding protein [Clostridium sp.]MBK5234916.1 ABC transporter substrate-binding protein [Clostridium sp.]
MIKSKYLKGLFTLLIICMVFVGCAPGDTITTGKSPKEKIIRMSVSGTPRVDPATMNTSSDYIASVNLYDTLVYPAADGTMKPDLAESWKYDKANLTYTFKLRQDVKFHNGAKLTANDVVFSMNRNLTIGEGSAYLFDGIVKKTVAVDDYTVKIILEKPFGPFVSTLPNFGILCKDEVMKHIDKAGSYGKNGDYGKTWLLNHDAGSGKYVLEEVKQQEYMLATRFKGYWGGWDNKDAPDTIKLIDNTEASTVRTLIGNKELEIADEWQSKENVTAMSKLPGVTIGEISIGMVQNMMYNNKKAPTDDVNFRRALNCLYDYKMIAKNIFVDSPQAKGPVSANTPGSDLSLTPFTYDIVKAKEYLKKSKYANELDKYPVEFLINTDVADQSKISLALQAAAQQVGITVNITKAPWISLQQQVASVDTTPNIVCMSVQPHFLEAGSMLQSRYDSKSVGTYEQTEWLKNDEIDSMIKDALATDDNDERYKKYFAVQEKIVNEIVPSGWLVDLVSRYAYHSDYVYWPVVELAKGGEIPLLPVGYAFDFSKFKVYPDKK